MGPLGELGALFNPGMRHEMEERRAKQMLREEEGTGRKGRLGIDLENGVAVIPSTAGASSNASAGVDGAAGSTDSAEGAGPNGTDDPNDAAAPGESADQARSAESPDSRGAAGAVPQGSAGSATAPHPASPRSPGKAAGASASQPGRAPRTTSAVPTGKAHRRATGQVPPPAAAVPVTSLTDDRRQRGR